MGRGLPRRNARFRMSEISFREAILDDLDDLAAIYIDAVDTIGPRAYSPAQIAAWRRWPIDSPEEVKQRVFAGTCRVAEYDGTPVAFAAFTPPDHLDFLYTKGQFSGRGLATQLHQQLEDIARKQDAVILRTEASYLSRPVFNRLEYEVVEFEDVVRFEETFRRFKMRKILRAGPPATGPENRCIHPHTPSFKKSPRVAAEERVSFQRHDNDNPGWFKGIDPRGISGYFPTAWFEIDASTHNAIAQRDYDAAELSVQIQDPIYELESIGPWSRVLDQSGKYGWIRRKCWKDGSVS